MLTAPPAGKRYHHWSKFIPELYLIPSELDYFSIFCPVFRYLSEVFACSLHESSSVVGSWCSKQLHRKEKLRPGWCFSWVTAPLLSTDLALSCRVEEPFSFGSLISSSPVREDSAVTSVENDEIFQLLCSTLSSKWQLLLFSFKQACVAAATRPG